MTEKPQVCIIHGGIVFDDYDSYQRSLREAQIHYDRLLYAPSWKSWLAQQLTDHDVLLPHMPTTLNAEYDDWALYFSKIVPLLRPESVLIGHSLGGVFLAKYFTENPAERQFEKLILVAAPYDDDSSESLRGFKLNDATGLVRSFDEIHIFQSTDDPVVSAREADKFYRDLPDAILHTFNDMQHFNMSEFPELLDIISPASGRA